MDQAVEQQALKIEVPPFPKGNFIWELLNGIGIFLGLGLLWGLEIVRNGFFMMLDRIGVKPRRHRRASAFPPGQPRKHNIIQN